MLRSEITADGGETTLIWRHCFQARRDAPAYAAGGPLCLDALAAIPAGQPMPSVVGTNALQYGGRELYANDEAQWGGDADGAW